MQTFLHKKFKSSLLQYISGQDSILVALSSGQDSICLLKLLQDCLNNTNQAIQAIYIDHQWKNSSKKHVRHMANITKFTGIPITIYQIKTMPLSENEARKMRYKILIQHALSEQCNAVITGHNNDDMLETFISNLFRGTGLNGVTNFSICKTISYKLSIVRPLVNFSKDEIAWLCRLFYLPVWSDKTNYNLRLKRNRVRHELLPYIQNFFNPKIKQSLANFVQLYQEENEYIKENTVKLYIKSRDEKLMSISLKALSIQHKIMQKRVLKLYFYYHFHKQTDNSLIKRIIDIYKNRAKEIFAWNQITIYINNGWLHVSCKGIKSLLEKQLYKKR